MIFLTTSSRSLVSKTYKWVKNYVSTSNGLADMSENVKQHLTWGLMEDAILHFRSYLPNRLRQKHNFFTHVQVFNPKERDGIVKNIIRSIFYPLGGVREIQRNSPFEIHVKLQAPWGRSKKMKLENFFLFYYSVSLYGYFKLCAQNIQELCFNLTHPI